MQGSVKESVFSCKSCLDVVCLKEPAAGPSAVQIINTDPVGSGSHWIIQSTVNCNDGDVEVLDNSGVGGRGALRFTCHRAVSKFATPKI